MKLEKFDYQIKNNKKNKSVIILCVAIIGLVAGFIIYRSFAAYQVTETYNIIKGSVANFSQEKLKISYNLVGEDGGIMSTNEIPSSKEYEYDATASKCENGTEIVYDATNNTITIDENAEDTCNIYFNYIPLSTRTLYALGYSLDEVKIGIPYGPGGTNETGFYAAEDDYGTSYYYYTNSDDSPPMIIYNGYSYYIIRINGNGSIRIINYDSYNYFEFNTNNNDNAYVGFMYGELGSSNILNTNQSFLMKQLESNYKYDDITLLDDSIFCNDRSLYIEEYGEKEADDTASGVGTDTTYYGAYYRIRNNIPSLKCPNKNDAFTSEDSEFGNAALSKPIGFLTADEAYMTNFSWYYVWYLEELITMTPAMFKDGVAYVYKVGDGLVSSDVSSSSISSREVVNLKAGLEFTARPDDVWTPYEIVQ